MSGKTDNDSVEELKKALIGLGVPQDRKLRELRGPQNRIEDLINNFSMYMNYYNENNPFSGPSCYFYIKIMNWRLGSKLKGMFNEDFIEWVYVTLASWGMHRMGPDNRGAKMNDFGPFKDCIIDSKSEFLELESLKLGKFELDKETMETINSLYFNLRPLMKSNSKLVATTKVMHFFLPELICPMDRSYTMKFFKKYLPTTKSEKDEKSIQKEFGIFNQVFRNTDYIAKKINCSKFTDNGFSPTVPKVIDGAIVGCVKKNRY